VEDDARCDVVAVDDLSDVASGDAGPFNRSDVEEAVRRALGIADWDRLRLQGSGDEYGDEKGEECAH
jgi:hypothetical protein